MFRSMASRRGLIAAVLGAALYPGSRARSAGAAGAAATSGQAALAAVCADLPRADAIGQACLRALPGGVASAEPLAALILADLPAASDRASGRTLATAVRQRSRDDFRDGRIVSVDGWMLSLTEARVYALAMLLARRSPRAG
jgi:hypothetical protein